jgi:hypothetical protein
MPAEEAVIQFAYRALLHFACRRTVPPLTLDQGGDNRRGT